MYACIYCDPDFSCGRVYMQPEVVQEVLADLKSFSDSDMFSWMELDPKFGILAFSAIFFEWQKI